MENKIDRKLFNIQDKTIIYGYMKPVLNRIAENIPPREWRWAGNYAELEPDVLDYWRQMINIIKRQQGLDFFEEAYILRYQGEETPFHDKHFGDALKQMEEKFGNIPILVKRWRLREEYKNI